MNEVEALRYCNSDLYGSYFSYLNSKYIYYLALSQIDIELY